MRDPSSSATEIEPILNGSCSKKALLEAPFRRKRFSHSVLPLEIMSGEITSIGSFVVKELVGQGSFSEVYNCVLPDCPDCVFAIKRLLSTCSSKKIVNEVMSLYLLKVCLRSRVNFVGLS